MIPNDTERPNITSGLRIGFAALTTRGATKEDAVEIADIIYDCLSGKDEKENLKQRVSKISNKLKLVETL